MGCRVVKFGGSSLADADAISQVSEVIKNNCSSEGLVVVVSAMGGITDLLLDVVNTAAEGNLSKIDAAVSEFEARHIAAIEELLSEDGLAEIKLKTFQAVSEFRSICDSVGVLRELTPQTIAKTVSRGERLMARLVTSLLNKKKISAEFLDATDVIKVMPSPIGMFPESDGCEEAVNVYLKPLLSKGNVVVVPGFIAEGPEKELVILGRGGSDFSAAILAASLGAESLTLYKEVDGILTADPRYVEAARIVSELHYREAAELAYYGAKVLHPCSIIPLSEKQVPLILKNTFHPMRPGTRIAGDVQTKGPLVKALTAIPDQAVIALEGKGMMGVPGIAGRTFNALARSDISVTMISQASSEASICFVVPGAQAKSAKQVLRHEFRFEISHHLIDDVKVRAQKNIIALVGLGMSGKKGTAARAFHAISKEGINIEVIAQGSSELNISVVLDDHHVGPALRSLHREFRLEKAHALPDLLGQKVSLAIFGFGQIGRTLVKQVLSQSDYIKRNTGSECQLVSLADTSGAVTEKGGISADVLNDFVESKRSGKPLTDSDSKPSLADLAVDFRHKLWSLPFAKGIFVDCTAAETASIIKEALNEGMNVVLANKKPLAVSYSEYRELFDIAERKGLSLRYEATVGAGLPILDSIQKLEASGDEVLSIVGCLSGTLGYIMTEVEDGTSFSEVVKRAYDLGYTEPDPRDDLSGMDVARKALILARRLGIRIEMQDIELEPLFPAHLSHDDPKVFLENLKQIDEDFSRRVEAARREAAVLRYVARISGGTVSVKIESIPLDSPLGGLKGTDNQVTLKSRRYFENPLVVTGPGAGAEVTAAGVLNDIVSIAGGGA